jgi:glucose uptake protein GlcU
MRLFLVFLLFSFIGGTFFWSEKSAHKAIALIAVGLLLIIGYFFFYQL